MACIVLNPELSLGTIDKNIFGQFSEHLGHCIYEGLFVGEGSPIPNTHGIRNDVIEALRRIRVPVLRWPGGCFADEYHWEDGIGPRENRKRMVNNNWGGVVEDNSFGTHEFLELCELIGCEPYVLQQENIFIFKIIIITRSHLDITDMEVTYHRILRAT